MENHKASLMIWSMTQEQDKLSRIMQINHVRYFSVFSDTAL